MKLRDLLDEKIIQGVRWNDSALGFVGNQFFPLTTTISDIINKGTNRIGAFHITGPDMVNNLKSIQGSKKSISCMTAVPYSMRRNLIGIWQHGILYYVEGDIVLQSEEDIMSRPDNQGRRWLNFYDIPNRLADELGDKFERELEKDKEWDKLNSLRGKDADKSAGRLVARHIEIAEKFAKKHKKQIRKAFRGNYGNSPWDEIVLNNIELIDCIYAKGSFVSKSDEQKINTSVKGKAIAISSDDSDKVEKEVNKFIKERGYGAFLDIED